MIKARSMSIGVLATATLIASACSVASEQIMMPEGVSPGLAAGTFRSTVWQFGDSGLDFKGAYAGAYRNANGSRSLVDEGTQINLSADEVSELKANVDMQQVIEQLTSRLGSATPILADRTSPSLRRPEYRGGTKVALPALDGSSVVVQFAPNVGSSGRPRAAIVSVNGRAIAIQRYLYRKTGDTWSVSRRLTTVLDSVGKRSSLLVTDYGLTTSSTSDRAWGLVRTGLDFVGESFLQVIQPDALHAETVDRVEDDGPCTSEMNQVAGTSLAWAACLAIVNAAYGSCVVNPILCPALIIAAEVALLIADIALADAIAALYLCQNPPPPPPPPPPVYGQTGGGGGQYGCYTVDWWVSYDDGVTWSWFDSEEVCEFAT